jgi:hypothetical protein
MKTETYDTTYVVNNNEHPCIVEYERNIYTQEEMQVYNCRWMEIQVTAIWLFPGSAPKGYNLMDTYSWALDRGSVFAMEEEIRQKIEEEQREQVQEALFVLECEHCF